MMMKTVGKVSIGLDFSNLANYFYSILEIFTHFFYKFDQNKLQCKNNEVLLKTTGKKVKYVLHIKLFYFIPQPIDG